MAKYEKESLDKCLTVTITRNDDGTTTRTVDGDEREFMEAQARDWLHRRFIREAAEAQRAQRNAERTPVRLPLPELPKSEPNPQPVRNPQWQHHSTSDSDVDRAVAAWPTLPVQFRRAILALIE